MRKLLGLGLALSALPLAANAMSMPSMPSMDPVGMSVGVEAGTAMNHVHQQASYYESSSGNHYGFKQSDARKAGTLGGDFGYTWALNDTAHLTASAGISGYSSHPVSLNVNGSGALEGTLESAISNKKLLKLTFKHYIKDTTNIHMSVGAAHADMNYRLSYINQGNDVSPASITQEKGLWGSEFGAGVEHFLTPEYSLTVAMASTILPGHKLNNHNYTDNDTLTGRKMNLSTQTGTLALHYYF